MRWIKIAYLINYDLDNWGPIEHKKNAACFDLRAAIHEPVIVDDTRITKIPLGIKIEFPEDCCMEIYPRSGVGSKGLTMTNGVGQIDSDYRGEIKVPLIHVERDGKFKIYPGDRIVQAKLVPIVKTVFIQCNQQELSHTDRDENGFGTYTGKN